LRCIILFNLRGKENIKIKGGGNKNLGEKRKTNTIDRKDARQLLLLETLENCIRNLLKIPKPLRDRKKEILRRKENFKI